MISCRAQVYKLAKDLHSMGIVHGDLTSECDADPGRWILPHRFFTEQEAYLQGEHGTIYGRLFSHGSWH
jgi:hypothetical protein